jgi:hypothetical protein
VPGLTLLQGKASSMAFDLIDFGWRKTFDKASASHPSELGIVSPFIQNSALLRLLRACRSRRVRVITRFRLIDFHEGVSDLEALRILLDNGAVVRGVRNLHAKLYLFGGNSAIVASANLTDAALSRNHEFGFIADDDDVIAACTAYFDKLWQRAGQDLNHNQIDEWQGSLAQLRVNGSRPSQLSNLPDFGADVGLPLSSAIPPLVTDAPQAFVKFFGESHNRAEYSLPVIEEVSRAGCHWACTYPKGKRPRQVRDGAIMFMGRLVGKPDDAMIFGRAVGIHHEEGRDDASAADLEEREWKVNWPHYIRVYHAEFVAGTLVDGVRLSDLMNDLGSNAFESTKRNAALGAGNTNPRNAYRQQAAVALSSEAYHWLNSRLEVLFETFGKIPSVELDRLDWPEIKIDHL